MRRCFFIFDYEHDLEEVRRIAELDLVKAESAAGFTDTSQWSQAKARGVEEVKQQIDEALVGTTCSVVFIGPRTANLGYVQYAIERSLHRGNGLLGVHLHLLKNPMASSGERGPIPCERQVADQGHGYMVRDWDPEHFVEWVNAAATEWRNDARPVPPQVARPS